MQEKKWWAPVVHFAAHTTIGFMIFLIIMAPAVALNVIIHALVQTGLVDSTIITILTFMEHAILVIDVVVFAVYLLKAAIADIKEKRK